MSTTSNSTPGAPPGPSGLARPTGGGPTMPTMSRRAASFAAVAGLVGSRLAMRPAAAAEPRSLTGTIDGAAYRIEVPPNWNGTLLLFSHGAVRPGAPNPAVHTRPGTEPWLLGQGYALAGSSFGRTGFAGAVESALHDNLALLDHFAATVGTPRRTIAWGQSLGGLHTALLVQKHPQRFDGAIVVSGIGEGRSRTGTSASTPRSWSRRCSPGPPTWRSCTFPTPPRRSPGRARSWPGPRRRRPGARGSPWPRPSATCRGGSIPRRPRPRRTTTPRRRRPSSGG